MIAFLLAQTIAITGGTVYPVSGPKLAGATVLIRDGRIVAVGANVPIPGDATRINAAGKWITPGLIDGAGQLGLVEINAPDPAYGISVDQVLIRSGAVEGVPGTHRFDDPAGGIFAALSPTTSEVIIEAMQAGVPGLKLTDDQRNQIVKAGEQLTRIADCKEVVSIPNDPLTPTDVQRGGQIQLVTRTRRLASRRQTRGL